MYMISGKNNTLMNITGKQSSLLYMPDKFLLEQY